MEASKLFDLASDITRQQATLSTAGKSDAARAIQDLARRGKAIVDGVTYRIEREDDMGRYTGSRYVASIDNPQGVHGFYGAPSKLDAMTWLAKKINPDLLPLCSWCVEAKAEEGRTLCWACQDQRDEAALDAWADRCEADRDDEDGGDDE